MAKQRDWKIGRVGWGGKGGEEKVSRYNTTGNAHTTPNLSRWYWWEYFNLSCKLEMCRSEELVPTKMGNHFFLVIP